MALHRGDGGLSALPQVETSRPSPANQGQPHLPHHLPGDDPGHHPPPHDSQPSGDWYRPADDPHLCPGLSHPRPLEVQAAVAREDLHGLHQLADEAPGGPPPGVLKSPLTITLTIIIIIIIIIQHSRIPYFILLILTLHRMFYINSYVRFVLRLFHIFYSKLCQCNRLNNSISY